MEFIKCVVKFLCPDQTCVEEIEIVIEGLKVVFTHSPVHAIDTCVVHVSKLDYNEMKRYREHGFRNPRTVQKIE